MTAAVQRIQHAYETFVRALRADTRRSAMLGVLVVVLLGMWVRLAMSGNGPTRTATAAPTSAIPSGVASVEPVVAPEAAARRDAMQQWLGAPVPPLGRNLFAVKLDYFPREGGPAQVSVGGSPDGFWEELAKSMSVQADQRRDRQVLVQNLQLQASQLRLQTTLMGPAPKAVINGAMVGEGDVVEGFRVLRIEARRIIVEREGIRLAVPMK